MPGQNQVHRRPGERDQQLGLARRNPVEPGDAADRIEHDLAGLDAETRAIAAWPSSCSTTQPKSSRMKTTPERKPSPVAGGGHSEPEQEQEEGEVDPDRNAQRGADPERSAGAAGARLTCPAPVGVLGFHRGRPPTSRRPGPCSARRARSGAARSSRGSRWRPSARSPVRAASASGHGLRRAHLQHRARAARPPPCCRRSSSGGAARLQPAASQSARWNWNWRMSARK